MNSVRDDRRLAGPPRLAGRDRELGLLRAHLGGARRGQGSVVLIDGEAGIGKTTLAETLLVEAEAQGMLLLVGGCYDQGETPPYGPWIEIARRCAALPPALQLPPVPRLDAATSREQLFAQCRDFLSSVATGRPVVLLLEDLHWADPASLDLLRFLGRACHGLPLLLLATYRAAELDRAHPLTATVPLLVREARAARLALRPLDEGSVRALVRARYDFPEGEAARLAAYLVARTEGNALFLTELLRTLEDEGMLRPGTWEAGGGNHWALGELADAPVPLLLRHAIHARVARLGDEDAALLAVAAVVGQEVPLDLWAAVAGADEDRLLATAERAEAARLLAAWADGAGVRFAHALIRDALYDAVPALRRRLLHRRAGEAHMALPGADPDAVAHHFQRAGDARAAEWLTRAGERAQRSYAWLTAVARYEAALRLIETGGVEATTRAWLLFRLATVRRTADPLLAQEHANEATRLAAAEGDRLLAGLSRFLAGLLASSNGLPRWGLTEMTAALHALEVLPDRGRVPPGAATAIDPRPRWGTVVVALADIGRVAEARELGDRCLADMTDPLVADWLGGAPYADAHSGTGIACAELGEPARGLSLLARARDLNRAVGHHSMATFNSFSALLRVALPYHADRPEERHRLLAEAEADVRRASGVHDPVGIQLVRAPVLFLEGRWAEVSAALGGIVGEDRPRWVSEAMLGVGRLTLGPLARAQGDPSLAGSLVRAALPDGPAGDAGDTLYWTIVPLQRLAAELALDVGDLAAARAWLAAHDRWLAWSGAVLGRAEGCLGWAAYYRTAGDLVAARREAARALSHAKEPRQPLALLATHRLLGEIGTDAGPLDDARTHLDAALALADACAAPYERALSLLALAEWHVATGDWDEAKSPLREARALLVPLGAVPALTRADALAGRALPTRTASPPRAALPAGLTTREAEVLRLVAAGLDNATIAERLFLSRSTVKAHVASIYGKLGVANRAAATRFALDHHLA